MNIVTKKNKPIIFMIGVASLILFVLSLGTMYNLTFFNSDTGMRFLQIQHLIKQDWRTFAIDYPARFADPTLQHVPYYYAYSVIDDNIYLNISPFLPLLASFLYYSLGSAGLSLLPILGALLTGLAIYRLVQLADLPYSQIAFGATIFATPLLFYSLTLWDHTLGTALAIWAVYWLVKGLQQKQRRALGLGGIAMGLALGQRPELYVFAIALGISLLLVVKLDWATLLTFGSGGLVGVLPIWLLQYLLVGHPLGMATAPHLLGYGKPEAYPFSPDFRLEEPFATRISVFLFDLGGEMLSTFVATLLLLIGTLLIVITLRVEKYRHSGLLLGGLIVTVSGYLILLFSALEARFIVGIFSTFALMPLSLTYIDAEVDQQQAERLPYRIVLFTTLIFLVLMILLWPTNGGQQWGARYLLPAYPLLLYLALHVYTLYQRWLGFSMRRTLQITTGTLLLISVLLQSTGVHSLYQKHLAEARIRDNIDKLPVEFVLTNAPYLQALMSSVSGKKFLYVKDKQDLVGLLERLIELNVNQISIVSLSGIELEVPTSVAGLRVEQIEPFVYELKNPN